MPASDETLPLDATVDASSSPIAPGPIHVADDRYPISLLLGRGGMGEVWGCEDLHLGRPVALKVARAPVEARRDVIREAQIQGVLEHPGILPVYDLAESRDGRVFFTMRPVRGVTLATVLADLREEEHTKAQAARRQLLAVFVKICLTIDYAHARGVIHRDIKPSNIMLGPFGEAYVLDWGIAAAANREHGSRPLGTPQYAAPEQEKGAAASPRSDVYSLGAVLSEIVTGMVVAPELEEACLCATAIDPSARFGSARELGDAVEAFLAGHRDIDLRKRLATTHLDAARRAAAGSSESQRELALAEVTRALAYAPKSLEALALLMRLLTEPPTTRPREVEAALTARFTARLQDSRRSAAKLYGVAGALLLPLVALLANERASLSVYLAPVALCAAALSLHGYGGRRGSSTVNSVLLLAALGGTSLVGGPFLVMPVFVAVTVMGRVLVTHRSHIPRVVGAGCALIVLLTVLAWFGLHPASPVHGEALVLATALRYSPSVAYGGAAVFHVVLLFIVVAFAERYRRLVERMETTMLVYHWQLSMLVPGEDAVPPAAESKRDAAGGAADTAPLVPSLEVTRSGSFTAPSLDLVPEATRYVPGRLLGDGGMGQVLLCEDARLGRHVAMKLLLPEQLDELPRFRLEARLQGLLDHPGIVPVYDLGMLGSRPFFTMRRVEGRTLEQALEDARTGARRAPRRAADRHRLLASFLDACLVVAFAHSRGVVHRDLKPANIMLGHFGEVYVIDWGLAKAGLTPSSSDDVTRVAQDAPKTMPGLTGGTPGFMAPEQALGDTVDERADVFSLGAILYEILSLVPLVPDMLTFTRALRAPETLDRRPSARAQGAPVSAVLDAICAKSIAHDRDTRFSSVRELHDALERVMNDDQDLSFRERLANEALERAQCTTSVALSEGAELVDRKQALRDVGEAIALAPQRRDALSLLRSLLAEPPPQGAALVAPDIRSAALARMSRTRFVVAGWILGFGVVATPIVALSAGVRSVPSLAAMLGSFVWAAAALVLFARERLWLRAIGIVALFGASASMSLADGPLLASPALAILFAMGRLLTGMRDERRIVVALAAAAIVVPSVLGLAGILVAYRFEPDGIVLQGALGAPPAATFLRLTLLHLACVLGCAAVAGQCRRHLDQVEEQTLLTTWQFSRLITDRERPEAQHTEVDL